MIEQKITTWLNSINERPEIKAINIGLFEDPDCYNAYLIGSNVYDPTDDDWACNEDFIPKNKYVKLTSTTSMDWSLFQEHVFNSLKNYIANSEDSTVFQNSEIVTVGFDDSELVRVK